MPAGTVTNLFGCTVNSCPCMLYVPFLSWAISELLKNPPPVVVLSEKICEMFASCDWTVSTHRFGNPPASVGLVHLALAVRHSRLSARSSIPLVSSAELNLWKCHLEAWGWICGSCRLAPLLGGFRRSSHRWFLTVESEFVRNFRLRRCHQ